MDPVERLEKLLVTGPGGVRLEPGELEALRREVLALRDEAARADAVLYLSRFAWTLHKELGAEGPADEVLNVVRELTARSAGPAPGSSGRPK